MFKVMIVDDEPVISHGLVNFVNWGANDCEISGEAENGLEAIELIKRQKPDIVISDIKMPGLDGLGLAKYLYENYPEIKMILLTGYADFAYAQRAIQYGIIEFLLKPVFTEKIIESVNKAKQILIEAAARKNRLLVLESQADDNMGEIREKFIRDVISEVIADVELMQNRMKSLGIRIERYFLLVFQLEEPDGESPEEPDKFMYSMKNFISLTFQDYRHYNAFMNRDVLCTVLTFDSSEEAECVQIIIERCEKILSIASNYMKFTISIGVSSMYRGVESLSGAYREAFSALEERFYSDGNIFVFSNNARKDPPSGTYEVNAYLNKMTAYIQSGQCGEAVEVMKSLLGKERETRQTVDHATGLGINICSFCSRLLSNFNLSLEDALQDGNSLYKRIVRCEAVARLQEILTEVIQTTCGYLNSSQRMNSYIVTAAKGYIAAHYHENIKLNTIADFVHVNSSYLSRVFKKETGETITEVINRHRVEKAKELLPNKNIKTYEVAAMVGIDDSTYFSQVFKKYAGVSPTEYRYFNGA